MKEILKKECKICGKTFFPYRIFDTVCSKKCRTIRNYQEIQTKKRRN